MVRTWWSWWDTGGKNYNDNDGIQLHWAFLLLDDQTIEERVLFMDDNIKM